MIIESIFAVSKNGVMGNAGVLPWEKIKEDMHFFSTMTRNSHLIMGRKTWESPDMLRPLPKRKSVVLTNNPEKYQEDYKDIEEFVQFIKDDNPLSVINTVKNQGGDHIFIIGGPTVLFDYLPFIQRAYITFINQDYPGDVFIDTDKYTTKLKHISTYPLNKTAHVKEFVQWSNI